MYAYIYIYIHISAYTLAVVGKGLSNRYIYKNISASLYIPLTAFLMRVDEW